MAMLVSGGSQVGEVRSTELGWALPTGKVVVFYKEADSRTSSIPCHVTPHIARGKNTLDPGQDSQSRL